VNQRKLHLAKKRMAADERRRDERAIADWHSLTPRPRWESTAMPADYVSENMRDHKATVDCWKTALTTDRRIEAAITSTTHPAEAYVYVKVTRNGKTVAVPASQARRLRAAGQTPKTAPDHGETYFDRVRQLHADGDSNH